MVPDNTVHLSHILEEHPTPFHKYEMCGSQVTPWRLKNRHPDPDKFRLREERHIRRVMLQHYSKAGQV